MESRAIDPVDFREAQHRNWDSAAVGWMEWSEFNDRADAHISERLVELADVRSGSRVPDVAAAMASRRPHGPRARAGRTAALWPRTSPRKCLPSGVNARQRPVWETSSSDAKDGRWPEPTVNLTASLPRRAVPHHAGRIQKAITAHWTAAAAITRVWKTS